MPRPNASTSLSPAKVLTIAWREFKHTALTRGFIFGAVIVPALITGLVAIMPLLLKPNVTPLIGVVKVASDDPALLRALEIEIDPKRLLERRGALFQELAESTDLESSPVGGGNPAENAAKAGELMNAVAAGSGRIKVDLKVEAAPLTAVDDLKAQLRKGEIVALIICPADSPSEPSASTPATSSPCHLLVGEDSPPNHNSILERVLADALVRVRADRAGQDVDELRNLVRTPDVSVQRLTAAGGAVEENRAARTLIPMGFMMLLWISTFVSANYLLTTTIEEKSNKVMEVLLSAVSPMELLTGKILGQALVSTLMMLLYAATAGAALSALAVMNLIHPIQVLWFICFFIMAYFMIASIMAGVGSAVNDLHEAQSLIAPAMMSMIIPLILWPIIAENPNGLLGTVMSFVPPVAPFIMILRLTAASEQAPLWQTLLALIWGYGCMIGMIWLASRIFRVGVLMTGKPPTPLELIRWARYR